MDPLQPATNPVATDPAATDPMATDPVATATPASTTNTAADPIATTASTPGGTPSNTSNGNQIAVLSTIDYSTHTMVNYYSSTTVVNHYHQSTTDSANSSAANDSSSSLASSASTAAVHYRFRSGHYFNKSGHRQIDRIVNFNGDNGDRLELSRSAFKGLDKLDLAVVSTRKERREAAKTTADIIYQQSSGKLFFNANDTLSGFGRDGGCFAMLQGSPQLSESHFILF